MTAHAKDSLRRSGVTKVLDLPFAVPTSEASSTEGLVPSKDSQVLDLVATGTAAVGAVVAY